MNLIGLYVPYWRVLFISVYGLLRGGGIMGRGYRYRDEPCKDVIDNLVQHCYKLATVSNTTLLVTTLFQPCYNHVLQDCSKLVTRCMVTSLTFRMG